MYFPNHVPWDDIGNYSEEKKILSIDGLKGIWNNVPWDIFSIKVPDCALKIMFTCYGLRVNDRQKYSTELLQVRMVRSNR